jgi:DNA polymerase delta subunit 3
VLLVTEDYSSYESVDEEEEPEPKKSSKKKSIAKDAMEVDEDPAKSSAKSTSKESTPPAKPAATTRKPAKPKGGSKLRQNGSIANFFGPAKNK